MKHKHVISTPREAGRGLTEWVAECSCGALFQCFYSKYGLEWKPLNKEAEKCPHNPNA